MRGLKAQGLPSLGFFTRTRQSASPNHQTARLLVYNFGCRMSLTKYNL